MISAADDQELSNRIVQAAKDEGRPLTKDELRQIQTLQRQRASKQADIDDEVRGLDV